MDTPLIEIVPAEKWMMQELERNATADNHFVLQATHVVKKHGEIVGYLSINAVPSIHLWMDTKKTDVKDSLVMERFFLNEAEKGGAKFVFVPCQSTSPYINVMERRDYKQVSYDKMFVKGVA